MPQDLSRRSLFQAAGGLTLLGLASETLAGDGFTAPVPSGTDPLPIFTALPYLQAGPDGHRLVEGAESIVVAWQTTGIPAAFGLTYGEKGSEHRATVSLAIRGKGAERTGDVRMNYSTRLEGLKLGTRYR